MSKFKRLTTKRVTLLALMIGLQVILGKLIQIPMMEKEYNLGFVPIAVAGWLLGAPSAMIVGALGDVVGSLLFPTGTYFPGFTLTALLVGLLYGLWLHGHRANLFHIGMAVLCTEVVNLFLNSLWLSVLYSSKNYATWLTLRAPVYLPEAILQALVLFLVLKGLQKLKKSKVLRMLL